ncbi:hypothetical protein BASA50_004754 [Batrachochytrium salamandrivorans]|uniref:Uncharacterized protein n=1 Tax=Batrachochytrium salamandrivorans TaxID=1357716 RepID=A0ABQ8FHN5_9FUNG|nr:hypothetical protein BASA60_008920 [Batrachochytrium salamandrivorans]KAH6568504.1 hypothetical protein BASA62_005445 [Batrachochytrium salamandrivorans]KAH6594997.1 hypothetical protein BASA61_003936 [Batrachochytrium salamandrivorans]KAH6596996.1 hypothetical protein BASA50_004754 [Batrachochytrium salamandrivorans]KAH9245251.1 hypothetical protein BASA81_017277 [Batrachochytrium salamandrivorans]
MKFRALVVAAMAIASVNAAGKGKSAGYFGLGSGSCTSRSLDHTKKEQSSDLGDDKTALSCSRIFFRLKSLQNKILGLAKSFENQLPFLHTMTHEMVHWETMQNGDTSKEHGEDGAKMQNTKGLRDPLEKYGEAKSRLQDTRHDLICLNSDYRAIWSVFTTQCDLTKYPNLMDPKKMEKKGSFLIKRVELPEDMRGTSSTWEF